MMIIVMMNPKINSGQWGDGDNRPFLLKIFYNPDDSMKYMLGYHFCEVFLEILLKRNFLYEDFKNREILARKF